MAHPFGEYLRTFLLKKPGLTKKRLAHMMGYNEAVLVRMAQGKKDLTGPSGRDRVIVMIAVLRDEGVLRTVIEANRLLATAGQPPVYHPFRKMPHYCKHLSLSPRSHMTRSTHCLHASQASLAVGKTSPISLAYCGLNVW